MGRFMLPACYNYLQILGEEKSALTEFVGKLNLLPILGEGFPKAFPVIFAVILLVKLLNWHQRILGWLGLIEQTAYNSPKWTELVLEGRKVIYKHTFLVLSHLISEQ